MCLIFSTLKLCSQSAIITEDIHNFWEAYDRLYEAETRDDSISIIQTEYLYKASLQFKKFIKLRDFTAEEYVELIGGYPLFWESVRPLTLAIDNRREEIDAVMDTLASVIPNFRRPDVCFAIGCLRTGGTTSSNLLLIGAEIAAADSTVDKSEMTGWLESVIGNNDDITAMVAHETIHTQQSGIPFFEIFKLIRYRNLSLLNQSITEGSCDYITSSYLGLNINGNIQQYGDAHFCDLMAEFQEDMMNNPYDVSNWLYNGNHSKDKPADLGYYIGYRITEEYFRYCDDKATGIKTVLKRGQYKKVYQESKIEFLCLDE